MVEWILMRPQMNYGKFNRLVETVPKENWAATLRQAVRSRGEGARQLDWSRWILSELEDCRYCGADSVVLMEERNGSIRLYRVVKMRIRRDKGAGDVGWIQTEGGNHACKTFPFL